MSLVASCAIPRRGPGEHPPHCAKELRAHRTSPLMVPIRSLSINHRDRITKHQLCLDAHDRDLRFGYVASDEHIRRYAEGLDFERNEVFGIYNRRLDLFAVAHPHLPTATLDSRMTEIVHEQLALADYRMKSQARQFSSLLAKFQAIQSAADTAEG